MKKIILFVLCALPLFATAQIYPNIGQFHNALLYYNPAYAGSGTQIRATGIYRTQWTKYPGAPNTQVVTVEAPLGKNVGGGVVLNRHAIGNILQINFSANASYRIKTGRESFVQFGLKAGISQMNFGAGSSTVWDENDPYISANTNKGIIGTFGAGVFYKKKSFYAGLSIPDLVLIDPNKLYYDEATNKSLVKKNFFFITGVKLNLTDFIALQPNVLIRYYPTRPLNYYLNLSVIFNQTFTAGVGFMYPKALALYTNVNITPKLILGYRYEFNTSGFALGNYGSSEILVRYGFN